MSDMFWVGFEKRASFLSMFRKAKIPKQGFFEKTKDIMAQAKNIVSSGKVHHTHEIKMTPEVKDFILKELLPATKTQSKDILRYGAGALAGGVVVGGAGMQYMKNKLKRLEEQKNINRKKTI